MASKNQSDGNAEMTIPNPGKNLVVPTEWYRQTDQNGLVTTYDLKTDAGRRGVLNARMGDPQGAEEFINTVIEIQHVVMHPVELLQEATGEVVHEVRTILIDKDGGAVSFVSRGIVNDLMLLSQFYRPGPWMPPLKVKLKRKQLNGGRSTYKLEIVE